MNAVDLLVAIIREHAPEDIWRDSPLVGYRMLGNTNLPRYLPEPGGL